MKTQDAIESVTKSLYGTRWDLDEQIKALKAIGQAFKVAGDDEGARRLAIAAAAVEHARQDVLFAIGRARGLF